MTEPNENDFARRAQEELDLASAATDPAVKAAHLDRASEYATARERAARGETLGSIAPPAKKSQRGKN